MEPTVCRPMGGERWTLVMRKDFAQPAERIWEMLTCPAQLARWSPIVPYRVLDTVGAASCVEHPGDASRDAEVLDADTPRRLVHRWGSDVLMWSLAPEGEGCRLELRQIIGSPEHLSLYAAGWHVCFGPLSIAAGGGSCERVVGDRAWAYGFQRILDGYRASLAKD